jgi:RNA polymerase sigma-70 factor (ECF subfamily)
MSPEHNLRESPTGQPDWFAAELAAAQIPLWAYIRTLLAGSEGAWEVLQNANRVMCEKAAEVTDLSGFRPWAYTVVRYEVLTYRKRAARDRHVFSQAVVEKLADRAAAQDDEFEDRVAALKHCLGELPERQRQSLDLRYREGNSLGEIARLLQRSETAVGAMLYRARLALARCIEGRMVSGDAT